MPARSQRILALCLLLYFLLQHTPVPAVLGAGSGAESRRFPKSAVAPNELGLVPILEYHLIGRPEGRWRRTPENFRRDLEMLYELGYYPVRLLDYVAGRLDVPAGLSPVVLTFDDSSEGQFRAIVADGRLRPDADSAVGIMEDFQRRHPDFPARATFFVLPGIEERLRLFGQPAYRKWKLTYLVRRGYELGNHTLWHQNLAKAEPEEVRRQLALAQTWIEEYVPGYRLATLSLPMGAWPKPRALAYEGTYEGVSYRHRAVLLVGAGPAPSPADRAFDPLALPRIQAGDGPLGPAQTLRRLHKQPYGRYVSDGNPAAITVPIALAGRLRRGLQDRAVYLRDDAAPKGGTGGPGTN